jgi:ATP-dependent Clp protease ATP-binding subunit ClpC
MSERYINDRYLPDKAIDVMDEAGARVHITNIHVPQNILDLEQQIEDIKQQKNQVVKSQQYEEAARLRDREKQLLEELEEAKNQWEEETKQKRYTVTESDVAEVIAMMTGVPTKRISEGEGARLLNMGGDLKGTVIGQEKAIDRLTRAIHRTRAGLKDPKKPIGSFIFLGPTGVGKTELAKSLTHYLFDTEESLIRIDMSEYMEKFAVSRLVGAPPGYVGYEEGGQLTEKVRRKPYSVILLDEIEKAHPDVYNILLQILDEGFVTDSMGRRIDFRNTVIIMTSNIGTTELKDFGGGVGFNTAKNQSEAEEKNKNVIEKALKRTFSPEFLNRIDDVIVFNSLTKEDIHKIIDLQLDTLFSRIKEMGYNIKVSKKAKEFLTEKGYDPKFGARPLQRVIQKYLEDNIAEEILRSEIQEGDTVAVELSSNQKELKVKVEKGERTEKSEQEEHPEKSGNEPKDQSASQPEDSEE